MKGMRGQHTHFHSKDMSEADSSPPAKHSLQRRGPAAAGTEGLKGQGVNFAKLEDVVWYLTCFLGVFFAFNQ